MKKHRIFVTIMAIIMALMIIVPMLTMIFTAGFANAVSQADIDALQQQQEDLKKQQSALQAKIDANKGKKTDIIAQKEVWDKQIDNTKNRINNYSAQITGLNAQITAQQAAYDAAQKEEEKWLLQFNKQLRSSEELGSVSYLSILFGARSFSDLLGRMDFMSQVYTSEEYMVKKLRDAKATADNLKKSLEVSKSTAETAKSEEEQLQAQLASQIQQADSLIKELESTIADENSEVAKLESAQEALAQQILEMVKKRDAENSGSNAGASGVYIWPSDCRYITSPFGSDLLNGVWRKHNGVDIGASYGTSIYAADGGTVVSSTYSSSYGNYVMISHGSGRYTLYAHMSSRLVSDGDSVSQGQVIGKVGSTGYSFGAHLHFETIQDGAYVNPLNYLSGYIQSW